MIDSYALFMLLSYFMFLFGILYMSHNVERVAQHPLMESLAEKIRYNLRDVPRVNYKEISSDDEVEEKEDSQSEYEDEAASEASQEESDEPSEQVRKRRDRNPISRIMEVD